MSVQAPLSVTSGRVHLGAGLLGRVPFCVCLKGWPGPGADRQVSMELLVSGRLSLG